MWLVRLMLIWTLCIYLWLDIWHSFRFYFSYGGARVVTFMPFLPLSAESKKFVEDWLSSLRNTWCTTIHHCDPALPEKNLLLWSLANKPFVYVNIVKKKRHWCDVRIWLVKVESWLIQIYEEQIWAKYESSCDALALRMMCKCCCPLFFLWFESPNIVTEFESCIEVWLLELAIRSCKYGNCLNAWSCTQICT